MKITTFVKVCIECSGGGRWEGFFNGIPTLEVLKESQTSMTFVEILEAAHPVMLTNNLKHWFNIVGYGGSTIGKITYNILECHELDETDIVQGFTNSMKV